MEAIENRTHRISVIAMLSAVAFIGRMMFFFLPNVQPMTVIIVLTTIYVGLYDGMIVAFVAIIISNLYLGMGIWTIH